MVSIFNLTGATTVTGVETTTGPTFGQPKVHLDGPVFRIGSRYTF
jgi:hypothetical protein